MGGSDLGVVRRSVRGDLRGGSDLAWACARLGAPVGGARQGRRDAIWIVCPRPAKRSQYHSHTVWTVQGFPPDPIDLHRP